MRLLFPYKLISGLSSRGHRALAGHGSAGAGRGARHGFRMCRRGRGGGLFYNGRAGRQTMAQAGITGIKRISFFIVSLMLTKDSPQVVSLDGASNEFFQARAIGTSRPVLLER